MGIRLITVSGNAVNPYSSALANLRIAVFRAFPYLYDGDLAYEEQYLQAYSQSENSCFVLVFDGEQIVGASTGLPLVEADEAMQAAFLQQNEYRLNDVFYFGESVLLSSYRGQGIGKAFFQEREAFAKKLNLDYTAFCAVERAEDHPLRPTDYRPLDAFWRKQGYVQQSDLHCFFEWKDIEEEEESTKKMVFWVKKM